MKMTWKKMAIVAGLGLAMAQSVSAAEVLLNGGFETGSFAPEWSVGPNDAGGGACDQVWTVASSGSACWDLGAPSGNYGAYTIINGAGPVTRTFSQSFELVSATTATLSWLEAAKWDVPIEAAEGGIFSIDLLDSGSNFITNIYTEDFLAETSGAYGLTANSTEVDFAGNSLVTGDTVYIAFTVFFSEFFTGNVGKLVDNVVLGPELPPAGVPEPGSLALLGLGLAALGLRRRATA